MSAELLQSVDITKPLCVKEMGDDGECKVYYVHFPHHSLPLDVAVKMYHHPGRFEISSQILL